MKKLNIAMAYTYVGDTSIDVPDEFTFEEAVKYAQDHIDDVPVSKTAEYIPYSDTFENEDCNFCE